MNLPPGVRECDIPGNRPEDAAWDAFIEWAWGVYTDSGLTLRECHIAVHAGVAAVQASRDGVAEMVKEALEDARSDYLADVERSAG